MKQQRLPDVAQCFSNCAHFTQCNWAKYVIITGALRRRRYSQFLITTTTTLSPYIPDTSIYFLSPLSLVPLLSMSVLFCVLLRLSAKHDFLFRLSTLSVHLAKHLIHTNVGIILDYVLCGYGVLKLRDLKSLLLWHWWRRLDEKRTNTYFRQRLATQHTWM